uniref:Uncharacterized protein n=1 Tax=Timema douglasi TaxID=61478 RepID=A0A7R8VTA5_TIMDO|nr:unnamed protein product [Timema douglasi]
MSPFANQDNEILLQAAQTYANDLTGTSSELRGEIDLWQQHWKHKSKAECASSAVTVVPYFSKHGNHLDHEPQVGPHCHKVRKKWAEIRRSEKGIFLSKNMKLLKSERLWEYLKEYLQGCENTCGAMKVFEGLGKHLQGCEGTCQAVKLARAGTSEDGYKTQHQTWLQQPLSRCMSFQQIELSRVLRRSAPSLARRKGLTKHLQLNLLRLPDSCHVLSNTLVSTRITVVDILEEQMAMIHETYPGTQIKYFTQERPQNHRRPGQFGWSAIADKNAPTGSQRGPAAETLEQFVFSLGPTLSVAFLLLATPAALRATHQYTPASVSLRLCATRRKKREPSGRSTTRPEAMRGTPSLYHVTEGAGTPSARHLRVSGSCRATVTSVGCSVMRGLRPVPVRNGIHSLTY